jgi:hypothetical protein
MKSLKFAFLVTILCLVAAAVSHAQDVTQTYAISFSGIPCGQVTFEATPDPQVWAWSSGGYEGKLLTKQDPDEHWIVTFDIYCDIPIWDPAEEKWVMTTVVLGTVKYIPFLDLFVKLSFPELAEIGVPTDYMLERLNMPPGEGDMENPFVVIINYKMDGGDLAVQ